MNTIGRNYDVSLSSARDNTFEFYVPLASSSMSVDELQTYAGRLQSMVDNWTAIAQDPGNNSTETNNAWAIVQILQGRLDEYVRQIASRSVMTSGETDPTVYAQDPVYSGAPGSDTGGGTSWLLILAIAGGAWLLFGKSRRRKNQVATRKKISRK